MKLPSYHKKQAYSRGIWSEKIAAIYLWLKGYSILECRYKTGFGEIDIIAKRGNQLIFIEVKSRPSIEEALFSISPKMKNRITQAARIYLSKNQGLQKCGTCFDVIAVKLPFTIKHIKNAW